MIQANITNTIVASYTTGIAAANPLSVTSDYNYFSNAPTAIDIGSQSISGTEHYLLFANAAAGNYRPALGSPAPTHGSTWASLPTWMASRAATRPDRRL